MPCMSIMFCGDLETENTKDKYVAVRHGMRVEHEMESEEAAVTLMLIYSPPGISMTGSNFITGFNPAN